MEKKDVKEGTEKVELEKEKIEKNLGKKVMQWYKKKKRKHEKI